LPTAAEFTSMTQVPIVVALTLPEVIEQPVAVEEGSML